jgi:hypothetical protein
MEPGSVIPAHIDEGVAEVLYAETGEDEARPSGATGRNGHDGANAMKSPSLCSLPCNVTSAGRKLWTLPPHQAQI